MFPVLNDLPINQRCLNRDNRAFVFTRSDRRVVLWAMPARAAGLQLINVPPDSAGPTLTGAVWSPCAEAPAQHVNLYELAVQGVRDCPVAGSKLPLIVISHGRAAWFGVHHDTAASSLMPASW